MNLEQVKIPTGAIKQFGAYGEPYIVEDVAQESKDEILVNIKLLRTGQRELYKLDSLMNDPEAN